jgi:hypothetical protein
MVAYPDLGFTYFDINNEALYFGDEAIASCCE